MLIHVIGTIFTDSETGASVDAERAVAECKRAAGEIQVLRESLGCVATAVHEACKRQVDKSRSLDNLNLDSIMNQVLNDQAQAGRPVVAQTEIIEVLSGLHKALSRMVEKYDPDSIESEWLGESNELIVKLTGHDMAGNNVKDLRAKYTEQQQRRSAPTPRP